LTAFAGAIDRRSRHHHPDNRLQRRIRHVQEPQLQRLGKVFPSSPPSTPTLPNINPPSTSPLPSLTTPLTPAQDLGGQTSIRPYWRCYYANTSAVIFVIDSTDIDRLATAAAELSAMLNEDELRDAALLVFANKQDQPGAPGAGDISEALRLGELRDRNWSIVACSAVDGRGVAEGMDWLVQTVQAEGG